MIVTLLGASGYVGKCVTGPFLDGLNNGRIKELRLLCRDPSKEVIQQFVARGAKSFKVNFMDTESLHEAISGSHAVVSCLEVGEGTLQVHQVVLEAMALARVEIFVPSEFGANHTQIKAECNHRVFQIKQLIFESARQKGLRPIQIFTGPLTEGVFKKLFGFDCNTENWSIVGSPNVPVAMTSQKDVGRFTMEAVLMAYDKPDKIVENLEVYSYQKTLAEYAGALDNVAGRPLKFDIIPLAEAEKEYKSNNDFFLAIRILFATGGFDHSNSTANELLNPGGQVWSLQEFEDYARETGGRPFKQ